MSWGTAAAGALAVAALAAALAGFGHHQYQRGFTAARAQADAQMTTDQRDQLRRDADVLRGLRAREQSLQAELAVQDNRHHLEQDHAQRESTDLLAGLRTRRVRLSVPTLTIPCLADPERQPDGAALAGDAGQAQAELAPSTAADLVAIVDDGDAAIRDLNACIDRYDTVKRAVNAPGSDAQGR